MANVQDEIAILIPFYQQFLRERRTKFERDVQRMQRAKGAAAQTDAVGQTEHSDQSADADPLPEAIPATQPVLLQPQDEQVDFLSELEAELTGDAT